MATGSQPRKQRWHYLYFLLGALDLLTVGVSLALSHTLSSDYRASVEANHELSELLFEITELSSLAQTVNAPGNDIFDSRDVATERARRDAALVAFDAQLASVASHSGAGQDPALASALALSRVTMTDMSAEANRIFQHFERGQAHAAGRRMATMDRKYAEVTAAISAAIEAVQRRQLTLLDQQVVRARELQSLELVIAGLMTLMVTGVVIYGHFVGKLGRRAWNADRHVSAYQAALDANAIVAITDARGDIVFANDKFCEISGYKRCELIGRNHRILNSGTHPTDFFVDMWRRIGRGQVFHAEICNRSKSGNLYWVDTTIVPMVGDDGRPEQFVSIRYDITKRVLAEQAEARTRRVSDLIAALQSQAIASGSIQQALAPALQGLLQMLDGRAAFVSELGCDEIEGSVANMLARAKARGVRDDAGYWADEPHFSLLTQERLSDAHRKLIDDCLARGFFFEGFTCRQLGADRFVGLPVMVGAELAGVLALDEACAQQHQNGPELRALAAAVGELLLAQRDLDRSRQSEESAKKMARMDALTGLGNRRALIAAFEARAKCPEASFGLLLIDLDRFKPINDLHGHAIGDEVLRSVAQRLRSVLRGDCAIIRLGGDEFVILTETGADAKQAAEVAKRALDAAVAPIHVGGHSLSVGASIGVAMHPTDAQTIDQLLQRADAAMYRAKERRGEVQFFDVSMDEALRKKAELEAELRAAIAREEIVPAYQPVVCLCTGAVIGYEVLARWPHKTRGFVPPASFIPIAENAGLVDAIFWRILKAACAEHAKAGGDTILSVNISPAQIRDPWFAQKLIQALAQSRFPPARLEIEITESAMISYTDKVRTMMLSLKNLGVRIALDDFGTGYSSLLLLRDLPLDKVKIDRSFVNGMAASGGADSKIVDAILGMAQALNLVVTAEGIETAEAANLLRERGCQYGQGYFFGAAQHDLIDTARPAADMRALA